VRERRAGSLIVQCESTNDDRCATRATAGAFTSLAAMRSLFTARDGAEREFDA
jgi:hypothetical protein